MNFLVGIIMIGLGVAILRYRYEVHNATGDWGWAEQYLGGNGTMNAIILIGMLLVAGGTAYPFGAFDGIFRDAGGFMQPPGK